MMTEKNDLTLAMELQQVRATTDSLRDAAAGEWFDQRGQAVGRSLRQVV
jgi:hypothetical protein